MFLGEPPRTNADLNFRLLAIPVRIHPLFWAVALLLGIRLKEPALVFIWILALFASILVHEMGHALAAKSFGFKPWVTLHHFGGLASYDAYNQTPRSKILVTLAGPCAGFVFAAVVILLLLLTGNIEGLQLALIPLKVSLFQSEKLQYLVHFLLFINIFWGLINLCPVYPLDGGQIARELFTQADTYGGIRKSLLLSVITSVALAVLAITLGSTFMAIMFGFFAYSSYTTLQSYEGRGNRW